MSNRPADPPVLVAALRHGLCPPSQLVALQADEVTTVSHLLQYDSLSGFLAVAAIDSAVSIPDEAFLAGLMDLWHQQLRACVILEALVVRVATLLDDAAVEWRLTKGAAVAHLDYPNPAVRTFGDVDLVVHPAHWDAAIEALLASGYTRPARALPGDYDDRYGKGATFTTPDGLEIDLHRRFAIGRFGVTSRMEQVFESRDSVVLAGRSIPTFCASDRLLHACYHASLGGYRYLRALRDVAQLILVTGADWADAFSVARDWRAEPVVASAIIECWQRLQLDTAHPAYQRAIARPISRADLRALEVFRTERPFRAKALTAIGAMPVLDVPRYLWTLVSHRD
ncbi:MAG: hypothetical protein F2789_01710 [Actinobacteria bacterium]|nr:hypothetical protein [Actinomycetota bacterium]